MTIPEGVTEIGGYAFYSCDSLTGITMPESVDEELMNTGSSVADMYPGESFNGKDMLYLDDGPQRKQRRP